MQKAPGQTSFDAYNNHGPNAGKTWDGKPIPEWKDIAPITQERWAAAEKAAGRLRLEQFPPVAATPDDVLLGAFKRAQARYAVACFAESAPFPTRLLLECFENELQKLNPTTT